VLKPLIATSGNRLALREIGRIGNEDREALRGVLDDILGR